MNKRDKPPPLQSFILWGETEATDLPCPLWKSLARMELFHVLLSICVTRAREINVGIISPQMVFRDQHGVTEHLWA